MTVSLLRNNSRVNPIEPHRPTISKQELESVLDCLIHDQLGPGKIMDRFERNFASAFGFAHSSAVNSTAAAYHLALLALGVGEGDVVAMSALAPVQAFDAVRYVRAEPLLIDVARNSFHPDVEDVEKLFKQTERPIAAFILDHTYGSLSPIRATLLQELGTRIIEDFTGLVGSEVDGTFAGNQGHVSICGLSPYDLLTTGNGAVLVTERKPLEQKIASLRYGGKRKPGSIAYEYALGDFQAALGAEQLSRIGETNERRKKIGRKYLEALRSTKHETYFNHPGVDGYLRFPVVVGRSMDEVLRYFRSLQIGATRAVEYPLHHLAEQARMEFPNAERLYQKAVAIPLYPSLTANNVERIASSLRGLL